MSALNSTLGAAGVQWHYICHSATRKRSALSVVTTNLRCPKRIPRLCVNRRTRPLHTRRQSASSSPCLCDQTYSAARMWAKHALCHAQVAGNIVPRSLPLCSKSTAVSGLELTCLSGDDAAVGHGHSVTRITR